MLRSARLFVVVDQDRADADAGTSAPCCTPVVILDAAPTLAVITVTLAERATTMSKGVATAARRDQGVTSPCDCRALVRN